jgi:photosystem II biogenesis protein Psp29
MATLSLVEPFAQEVAARRSHCGGKATAFLSLSIALGFVLLLLPWADISGKQHAAITMISLQPPHQTVIGKNAASSSQLRPLRSFQPSSSWNKPQPTRGLFSADATPRTLGDTKLTFQNALPRVLPSMYQAFIGEYLADLHFYVFSKSSKYDGLFALGLRDMFLSGSKLAGKGDQDDLWDAICTALDLDPNQVTKHADTMSKYAKSTSPDDIVKQMVGTEKPSDGLVAASFGETGKHSQFRSIGLLKLMEYSGFKLDKDNTAEWTKAAKIDNDRFMKDLQAFKSKMKRMQEGQNIMNDMTERLRKEKEAKKAKR